MRLEEALCRQPASILQSYQYLERQVNDGSPSGEHRTVSKLYSPIEGISCFPLPFVLIPFDKCEVIGNRPSTVAKVTIGLNEQRCDLKFFLHPDMANKLRTGKKDIGFQVFPTSSGRTVCRNDLDNPVYIKLHYDGMLGRIVRKMGREKVVESIYSSEDLDRLSEKGIKNQRFDFFPESLGLVSRIGEESFGFVVRDFNTRNQSETEIVPRVPWFSLFSVDRKRPNNPPLLKQWVESKVGRNVDKARDYVFENFLQPVVDCYTFLSTKVGIVSDYNAQNLLIIPDANGDVDRIAFRDLHSFYLDSEIRRQNGLPVDCVRRIDTQSSDPEDARYAYTLRSVYFDHKFSDYLLEPIVKSFSTSFGDNPEVLTDMTREYLLSTFRG
ncbi:MAG: hypothetical protein NTY75_00205, partial [Candidatus Shapirobacteria bacterium]|nr:hypothetical protein [Candidatus Shapirobacteria bacterium]